MAYKPFGGYVARRPKQPPRGYKPLPKPDKACTMRIEGDECVCHCGLRWAFADAKPECPTK